MLGLDAGQTQPSEPTTEEYPGAEDSASGDVGWAAARSYQKINRQLSQASYIKAKGVHFEYKLYNSLMNLEVGIFVFND